MDIDRQIQDLIANAPQDGTTPQLVRLIEPILKSLASQLQHLQYYVAQTNDQHWVVTTLSNRSQPQLEKRVVYAYPSAKDAREASGPTASQEADLMALPIPVAHILFQMLAMETVDSTVFFETVGNLSNGVEVRRADMQHLIQLQLQQLQAPGKSHPSPIPPDIA